MLNRVAIAEPRAADGLDELRARYRAFMEEHVYPNERRCTARTTTPRR